MSPERFRGQCDVRADVYSLGLTLYELLVLEPAFDWTVRFGDAPVGERFEAIAFGIAASVGCSS